MASNLKTYSGHNTLIQLYPQTPQNEVGSDMSNNGFSLPHEIKSTKPDISTFSKQSVTPFITPSNNKNTNNCCITKSLTDHYKHNTQSDSMKCCSRLIPHCKGERTQTPIINPPSNNKTASVFNQRYQNVLQFPNYRQRKKAAFERRLKRCGLELDGERTVCELRKFLQPYIQRDVNQLVDKYINIYFMKAFKNIMENINYTSNNWSQSLKCSISKSVYETFCQESNIDPFSDETVNISDFSYFSSHNPSTAAPTSLPNSLKCPNNFSSSVTVNNSHKSASEPLFSITGNANASKSGTCDDNSSITSLPSNASILSDINEPTQTESDVSTGGSHQSFVNQSKLRLNGFPKSTLPCRKRHPPMSYYNEEEEEDEECEGDNNDNGDQVDDDTSSDLMDNCYGSDEKSCRINDRPVLSVRQKCNKTLLDMKSNMLSQSPTNSPKTASFDIKGSHLFKMNTDNTQSPPSSTSPTDSRIYLKYPKISSKPNEYHLSNHIKFK